MGEGRKKKSTLKAPSSAVSLSKEKRELMTEAVEMCKKMHKFSAALHAAEDDPEWDPILLSLMKDQREHMIGYYNILLLRCEMSFTDAEFDILKEEIDHACERD